MRASASVGRIGGLAMSLGIGAAVLLGSPVPAWAAPQDGARSPDSGMRSPDSDTSATQPAKDPSSSAGSRGREARHDAHNSPEPEPAVRGIEPGDSEVTVTPPAAAKLEPISKPSLAAPLGVAIETPDLNMSVDIPDVHSPTGPVAAAIVLSPIAVAGITNPTPIAAITPVTAAAPVMAATPAVASTSLKPVWSPLFDTSPGGPVESPVSWVVLAAARRQTGTTTPLAAPAASTVPTLTVAPGAAAATTVTNSPPVISGITLGTANASTGAVSGTVRATDPNGDKLTYKASVSGTGAVSITSAGVFTYTPTATARHAAAKVGATSAVTTASVTVTVTDAKGAATNQTVAVKISPKNIAPTATSTVGIPNTTTGVVTGSVLGSDSDNDVLTYSVSAGPAKGMVTLDAGNGAFTYTPSATARQNAAKAGATSTDKSDTFTVSVTDGYGGSVVVPVSVAVSPLKAPPSLIATAKVGPSPQGIAVSPDGTQVFVTTISASGTSAVSVLSTANNTAFGTIPTGKWSSSVVYNPAGSRAYVANYVSGTVSVINTATQAVASTITLASGTGTNPSALAVSPDGTRVYTVNPGAKSVSVINTATNKVATTIAVSTSPWGIAVSPDGTRLYLANPDTNSVSILNTSTNQVTDTITVGSGAVNLAVSPNGSRLYVVNNGDATMSVIDTASKKVVATVAGASGGVVTSPDGAFVYTTNTGLTDGAVLVIDAATNKVTATVPAGVRPTALAISRDGTRLYVADNVSNGTVSVLAV